MYKIFTIIIAVLITINLQAQHNVGLHMIDGLYQQSFHNPAMFPDSNLVIALPSFFVNINHSGGSLGDFLSEDSDGNAVINLDEIANGRDVNSDFESDLLTNVDFHTFEVSIPLNNFAISLGHVFRNDLAITYPHTIVQLLADGNAQFIGETIEFGPAINYQSYSELRLGLGYKFANIKLGARVKLLSGIGDISTNSNSAQLTTLDDIYQIRLQSDYDINTSTFVDYNAEDGFDLTLKEFSAEEIITKNVGIAVDLGISATLGNKLTASVGVNDIGSINWSNSVRNFSSNVNKEYDAIFDIVLEGDSLAIENKIESLTDILDFDENNNEYSTKLPMKINAAINYKITEALHVGAASQMINGGNRTSTSFSIGGRYYFKKFLSAGLSYVNQEGSNAIGANLVGKVGPVQIFLTTDNIITAFDPLHSQFGNAGAGINLIF